jgi:hypothetical protein
VEKSDSGHEPEKPDRFAVGCLTTIIVAVALVGLFVLVGSLISNVPKQTDSERVHATKHCEEAVSGRLKAPATAQFNSQESESSPGVWTVVGTVDSENSFGALLRSEFQCTLTLTSDTKANLTVDYLR